MLIQTDLWEDGQAVLRLSGPLTRTAAIHALSEACDHLLAQGRSGIIVDLSTCGRVNLAGMAALVELAARRSDITLGYAGLPVAVQRKLRSTGLDRGLRIFDTPATAFATAEFRRHSLASTKAVVLCAGEGRRIAPLSEVVPKPMIDIAGQPVLARILQHLGQFGLRDVLVNPGHLGPQIPAYFRDHPLPGTSLFYSHEGQMQDGLWRARPIGSASSLKRLQSQNAAFESDFLVLCGDALIDLDLAALMRTHRDTGADITLAAQTVAPEKIQKYGIMETGAGGRVRKFIEKPRPGTTSSRLANTGIYVISPRVLDWLPDREGLDIACDLLPAVMDQGGRVQVHEEAFNWTDIGCGRDYAQAMHKVLSGALPGVRPMGREMRPGVWCAADAEVSRKARIDGPCYIGPGARIVGDVRLQDLSVIGAHAVVAGPTTLKDTLVMPETLIAPGVWAQHLVVHPNWAFDHRFAEHGVRNHAPVEGVHPLPSDRTLVRSTSRQQRRA
jgi:mannose-1-phosphate guanylyltransferase